jgi:hypothetical protein
LFFFEYNGYLRQGFLRIKDENVSGNVMFELKRNTPSFFVKNYTGEKISNQESLIKQPGFDLYFFSKFDINIEKLKKEFEQINEEKNLKFLSKSMRIPPSKLNLINIEEKMKSFVQKYEKNIIGLNNIFNSTISSSDNNLSNITILFLRSKNNFFQDKYFSSSSKISGLGMFLTRSRKKSNSQYIYLLMLPLLH